MLNCGVRVFGCFTSFFGGFRVEGFGGFRGAARAGFRASKRVLQGFDRLLEEACGIFERFAATLQDFRLGRPHPGCLGF